MRICVAHAAVVPGTGSARYIVDVAGRLAEDGHEVTLFCHECEGYPALEAAVDVVRVRRPEGAWGTWRMGHRLQLAAIRRGVSPHLAHRRFDLLLGSDLLFLNPIKQFVGPSLRFIYTPFSMVAPIEIALYELGGIRGWLGVHLYRRLQRWALNACDVVVRFTASAVRALERYYGVSLAGKHLISVYVSREFERVLEDETPIFERPVPRELVWVGRLVKSKNVDFLLRAVARLRSRDWVLNICNDGPERARLEALAAEMDLTARVRFLGHVEDLSPVYRRASLLLTASILEQYSLTVMEAYAFGVPCIGLKPDWNTVFNSNEDQIRDGVTGFVIRDEDEMAQRVDELLADESRRGTLARQAFATKGDGFTFERFYRDFSRVLEHR